VRYDYRKVPNHTVPKKDWIKRPLLQVTLHKGTKRTNPICLVDSGADDCLFHASLAKLLGIDLKSGKLKIFSGIAAGHPIEGYLHTVELQPYGMSDKVEVGVYFTEADGVSGLLGQTGFFENFKVSFEQYKGQFEVEARPLPTQST
jgi:hypothetical protein